MKWLNLHGSFCLHRQARECLQTQIGPNLFSFLKECNNEKLKIQ
jgi:hypothetical protein